MIHTKSDSIKLLSHSPSHTMTTRPAQTMKAAKSDPRPLSPRPFLSRARSKPRPIQRVLNLYDPDPAPSTLNALKPMHLYDINCAMPFRIFETEQVRLEALIVSSSPLPSAR
jgi:hypothetical protein